MSANPSLKEQEAIAHLLKGHQSIYNKLFNNEGQLRDDPKSIKESTRYFSTGEALLRDLALNFWNGNPCDTSISDAVNTLDNLTFNRFIESIYLLRYGKESRLNKEQFLKNCGAKN